MKQLAVFGFGLVGASLAAAVRAANPTTRLVAVDLAPVVASSVARALADELVDSNDRSRIRDVAEASDLCVLAAPVSVIVAQLPALLECAQVVTDCGSTKRSICAACAESPRRGRFVPGHPMAGGPEGGAGQARADLFRGQTWLLCPENSDGDAVERVESMISLVGAKSVPLALDAHDRAVAYTSHAPQILASALLVLAASADAQVAAGPAYRATTRSAGGAESMWRDIFSANADQISVVLRQLAAELDGVAAGLEMSPADAGAALALLAKARQSRDRQ
jgi:prephenate dehydrogenase